MTKYIVDENGVVLDDIDDHETVAKLKHGDRVVRGGSVEYLLGTVTIHFNRFIKVNNLATSDLEKYGGFLFTLFPYIGFADGILSFSNGRRLRPKHLYGLLRKKRKSGSKIVQELIDLDVIHKHVEGQTCYYTFNPYIAVKGTRVTKELYEEFKDTKYRTLGDDLPDVGSMIEKSKVS